MPTIELSAANRVQSAADFPRLKLARDERARILCIEEQPTYAYVHTLRAPRIAAGQPEIKTHERRDGTTYTDVVKDFIGRPLCLGDLGILADKGVDPANCPACARSVQSAEIEGPKRRFAMHVVRYGVRQNSFELRSPFSCEIVVWAYTDMVFDKLVEIRTTWGTLRDHDLLLGPCTDASFQKFEILPAPNAAWQLDRQFMETVVSTYRENRAPDLETFCGRKVERRWMEDDLARIAERWSIANRAMQGAGPSDGTETIGASNLTGALNDLQREVTAPVAGSVDLNAALAAVGPVSTPPATTTTPAAAVDFDSMLSFNAAPTSSGPLRPTSAPPAAPTTTTPAPPAAVDFDALLGNI